MSTPHPGGAGPPDLRRANTARVLRALRDHGDAGRAALADETGLARATVGTIVGDLVERGLLQESQPTGGQRGRPSTPVSFAPGAVAALGLEVNVDYVSVVALGLDGGVLLTHHRAISTETDPFIQVVEVAAAAVRRLTHTGTRLIGGCLAVPGRVSHDHQTVLHAPHLRWTERRPGEELQQAMLPLATLNLRVLNDADCAAWGEVRRGAAIGVDHALYLTGTVGIGAGLVEQGRLIHGARGFAGEVGHVPLGEPDASCVCGRQGCWETAVGLRALPHREPSAPHDPVATATAIATRTSDPLVRAGVDRVGASLGRGLAVLSGVLDPDVIVLGGYFVPLAAALQPSLDLSLGSGGPEVRWSSLGLQAAALGAAELVLADVWSGALTP